MSNKEKLEMLEEIMDLDEGTLSMDSVLNDYDEWDSLSKLSLIAMAKQEFGIILNADKIREFNTVNDIFNFLK